MVGEILELFIDRVKDGVRLGVTAALGVVFGIATLVGLMVTMVFILRAGQYVLKALGLGA